MSTNNDQQQDTATRKGFKLSDAGRIVDDPALKTAEALQQLHETVEALHQLHETEEALLTGEVIGRTVLKAEAFVPDITRLSEEEGLLVQKDGHLELEEEVKKSIIKAFKEDKASAHGSTILPQQPRIFGAKEKETEECPIKEQEKKTTAAAVKIIAEERKKSVETQLRDEASLEDEGIREDLLEKLKAEKPTIASSELLMVKGSEFAVGINYIPGMLPAVVAYGQAKEAIELIHNAFRMEIPVVEVPDWDTENFGDIVVGKEIPEELYPPAARALALIYRMQPGSHLVRFVKFFTDEPKKRRQQAKKAVDKYRDALKVAPLAIEISDVMYPHREELIKQLDLTINRLVTELGLIIPPVKIRLNHDLVDGEFLLKIKDVTYDFGVMDTLYEKPDVFYFLQGKFRSLIYNFGHELLGYAETEALVNSLKKHHPGLYRSLFPNRFTLGALRFILRGLLKEFLPIKDMVTILETIDEYLQATGDPEQLIEYIRASFSQYITNRYKDEDGKLKVILLSAETEALIMASIKESMNVRWLDLDHAEGLDFMTALGNELKSVEVLESPVVLLTSPVLRRFIRKITESTYPEIPVLSYSEVAPMTSVVTVGTITMRKI